MADPRFDGLSDGQREVLRLYHARHEIKDIARSIGRSPATVEQRLAAARHRIGANRSSEAARLFAQYERNPALPVQDIYAPIPMVDHGEKTQLLDQPSTGIGLRFPLPWSSEDSPQNEMTFARKLAYSLLLAAIVALLFGGAVAALKGLSDLL